MTTKIRRKPAEQRKEDSIRIRVTPAQKKMLLDAAERAGVSVSAWILMLGIAEARKVLAPVKAAAKAENKLVAAAGAACTEGLGFWADHLAGVGEDLAVERHTADPKRAGARVAVYRDRKAARRRAPSR